MEYILFIDGSEIAKYNHLKTAKKEAKFHFEHLNSYEAKIVKGNVTYYRTYNSDWIKMTKTNDRVVENKEQGMTL